VTLRPTRWLVGSLAVAVALAGGCSSRMLRPMNALPLHTMTLPRSTVPVAAADKPTPPGSATKHKWYVKPNGRKWRHIVIHHSASPGGNAAEFDRFHRTRRGWDELGYHFVIDNGRGGPDGRVEIGPRWRKQKHGAHTGQTPDNEYNEHGIGICLVGNFTSRLPTRAQLASLNELLLYLMTTHGIRPENVIGHRNAPSASTSCPGNAFGRYVFQRLRPELRRTLDRNTVMTAGRRR